jgi:hypothetical protein
MNEERGSILNEEWGSILQICDFPLEFGTVALIAG